MITERGKTILGKYMAGQNESTFSYLAIGIGAIPAFDAQISTADTGFGPGWWKPEGDGWKYWYYRTDESYPDPPLMPLVDEGFVPEYNKVDATGTGDIRYSNMKELDYEVLRIPITESGIEFVKQATSSLVDAALTDMILTGTIPSLGEYRFTEIGIYSAQSNAIASSKPSEVLFSFASVTESWVDNTSTAIPLIPSAATTPTTLGFCKSDHGYFTADDSLASHRRPRAGQYCLHLPNGEEVVHNASNFNFTNVRPDDQFRLAFFVDSKPTGDQPLVVDVTFEDTNSKKVTATLKTNGKYFVDTNGYIPTTYKGNLYGVAFAKVSDFVGDSEFSWSNVSSVSIKSKRKVFLDSLGYVSTNYNNPNYGLVSYSVVQNRSGGDGSYPEPLYKAENLETLLQYRVRINNSLNGEDYLPNVRSSGG